MKRISDKIFSILALVALVSCDSKEQTPDLQAEPAEIKINANFVESWGESRSLCEPKLISTNEVATDDGETLIVEEWQQEINHEPMSRAEVTSKYSFYLYAWLKSTANTSGREILYIDKGKCSGTDDNVWHINNQYTATANYRWTGPGTKLAFLGLTIDYDIPKEGEPNYDPAKVYYAPQFILSTPKIPSMSELKLRLGNKYHQDYMIAIKGVAGDYGMKTGSTDTRLPMKFFHLTGAVEVRVDPSLFKGVTFDDVTLKNICTNGSYKLYHARIYDKNDFSTFSESSAGWTTDETTIESSLVFLNEKEIPANDNSTSYYSINGDKLIYVVKQTIGDGSSVIVNYHLTSDPNKTPQKLTYNIPAGTQWDRNKKTVYIFRRK